MVLPLLLYTLLNFALLVTSQLSCEDAARQKGKPTDSWKPVVNPDGSQHCERVDSICLGQEFVDSVSAFEVSSYLTLISDV